MSSSRNLEEGNKTKLGSFYHYKISSKNTKDNKKHLNQVRTSARLSKKKEQIVEYNQKSTQKSKGESTKRKSSVRKSSRRKSEGIKPKSQKVSGDQSSVEEQNSDESYNPAEEMKKNKKNAQSDQQES